MAYEWNEYFPLDHPIYNANFQFENIDILCTDGLLIRTNTEWELYQNSDLATYNALKLNEENLIALCGNGSYSDGIYKFNLNTHNYEIIDWFIFPNFIYYNSTDYRFYLGSDAGLSRSYNGLKWVRDNSFEYGACFSMNNQNENYILSNEQGIFNWQYSQTPNFSPQQSLGLLECDEIDEASGLVASRTNDNVFWTFNDSGGEPAIYALNSQGEHLGIYTVDGVTNRDWEDIAIGGGPDYPQYIYIGEIGDNNNQYDTKYIYRFEEPVVNCNQAPVIETIYDAETISIQYPNANYDAETLMHDPLTNDLYIITKRVLDSPTGHDKVYYAEFPQSTTQAIVMEEVAVLDYPPSLDPFGGLYYGATAGEISPLGDEILIKTYTHVYHWKREQGQTLIETFQNDYNSITYTLEPQGEAICWEPYCNGYFTLSEEPSASFPAYLYFYDLNSWQLVNDQTFVEGFQFTSDGMLYAFMPGESYSSGLYSSNDLGENWDVCFWDMNLSAITLDCAENLFIGWEEDGVGFWETSMNDPLMMNNGLENQYILNLIDFPIIIDPPSVLACTQSGAYFLNEYTNANNYELPNTNYEIDNYPNPFNLETTIKFYLPQESKVELTIYNIKGKKVRGLVDDNCETGIYTAVWNGKNDAGNKVGTGVYFYKLNADNKTIKTKKMLLLK